jgi:hypothetical protein
MWPETKNDCASEVSSKLLHCSAPVVSERPIPTLVKEEVPFKNTSVVTEQKRNVVTGSDGARKQK